MIATSTDVQDIMNNAHGTSSYHRCSFMSGLVCTDSIKDLADVADAYWFIDLVASYNVQKFRDTHPFQLWTLTVKNHKAVVTMKEDTNRPTIVNQEIEFTDFPDGEWTFYNVVGSPSYHVMMNRGDY